MSLNDYVKAQKLGEKRAIQGYIKESKECPRVI